MLVKGFEIAEYKLQGSANRRAQMYKNSIVTNLKKIGVREDDVNMDLIPVAISRKSAALSWYFDETHLYFSYNKSNFIGNVHVIAEVIEKYVNALLNDERLAHDFIADFKEDVDVENKRKEARELLGVDDNADINEIDKVYKLLAKDHHPDMGGNVQEFQDINNAHKLLKRELV